MDWAEELKMSIKKTARKGRRRSQSRDLDGKQAAAASILAVSHANKEISIDITLDLQQNSTEASSTATSATRDSETRRPPLRRISGGWADAGSLKNSKSKLSAFDDERFQNSLPKSMTSASSHDDIPTLPDMDDVKDNILLNEIIEPAHPSSTELLENRSQEINADDLLTQKTFSSINENLSVLTGCLQPQATLVESDEVWEWDKTFTEVIAEINAERSLSVITNQSERKIEIRPDELSPAMYA